MPPRLPRLLPLLMLLAACEPAPAAPPDDAAARVLVVVNRRSADSRAIGEYYRARRGIPRRNLVEIDVEPGDEVGARAYRAQIEKPIRRAVARRGTIDYIVLTKGVPLRIGHAGGYSVDGHLAVMNRGLPEVSLGRFDSLPVLANPYFNARQPFSSAAFNMYLVTRLDCYERSQCERLVDNALRAEAHRGPFYFNGAKIQLVGGYGEMERILRHAHALLAGAGFESVLDTLAFRALDRPVAGYASWGSNDGRYEHAEWHRLRFLPGAIAETFVSTSGRTFSPTVGGQSLVADLVRQGVTGVKGYVSEPYTTALARVDLLFQRYTSGYNLAESFYGASLLVNWKDIVIGDPLCRPYAPAASR